MPIQRLQGQSDSQTIAMSSALHQSEESSQASITLQLGKLLRRVYSSRHEILEYNLATKSLSVWPWCVFRSYESYQLISISARPLNTDTGRRMDLECLRKHVLSPGGSSPRCLCSLKRIDAGFGFQPSTITRAGYFNFTCATNECGYDGKSFFSTLLLLLTHSLPVPLERIYRSESFMISSFPPQAQDGAFSVASYTCSLTFSFLSWTPILQLNWWTC